MFTISMNLLSLLSLSLPFYSIVHAQSSSLLSESGQLNKLIFDSVAQSPAFISRSQFVEAWTSSLPYLPIPNNVTFLNPMEYPIFMNTAVMAGNINNVTQLAIYFAQVLYETNGLSIATVVPCSRFGNAQACQEYSAINVNNTNAFQGKNGTVDYHGRGRLLIENVETFMDASQALYGTDVLYRFPKTVSMNLNVAWATSAWNWATKVGSVVGNSDAFGLTTKFLRPGDCASVGEMSDNAKTAFNIYQQVLSVFDPDRVATPAGCVPH